MEISQRPVAAGPAGKPADPDTPLRASAKALESVFLSEMLKSAGLDSSEGEFSGGIGEEQFSSFLRDEQAKAMTSKGGIGLAESIFRSLSAGQSHGG